MGATAPHWRSDLLCQLKERDLQISSLEDIFVAHARMLARCVALESRAVTQSQEVARLAEENEKYARDLEIANKEGKLVSALEYKDRIADLEGKLEQTRLELTESYKKKGEHAQKLLDLNELVQAKDDELKRKNAELLESENMLATLNKTIEEQAKQAMDQDRTVQVLQDEVHALQLELLNVMEKLQRCESEYQILLDRWLKKKNEEAQKLNEANALYESSKQDELATAIQQHAEKIKARRSGTSAASNDDIPWALVDELGSPTKAAQKINIAVGEVNALATTSTCTMFSVASSDKNLTLWDTASGKRKGVLSGSTQGLLATAFSFKDDQVLAASNDNATRIYDIRTQRLKHSLTGHISKVCSAQFATANKVVTGSHDRTIKVWDLLKGYCSRTIFTFSSCNHLVLTDEAGTGIVSGHVDNHIRFWDSRSGDCTNELTGVHTGQITCLDLSEDRNFLLTQSRDNTLKLIDLRMAQVVTTFCGDGYRTPSNFASSCFGPNSRLVAAGSLDGAVYLWNAQTGKVERTLREHGAAVNACTWNRYTNTLMTGDRDHTVVIWQV